MTSIFKEIIHNTQDDKNKIVVDDYRYVINNLVETVKKTNQKTTIFTTAGSLDDSLKTLKNDSRDSEQELINLCIAYGGIFKKEKEKINASKIQSELLDTQLYLSPLNTYIGSLKKIPDNRIGHTESREEYAVNKKTMSDKLGSAKLGSAKLGSNIPNSIGWKKIDTKGIFYGGPRDILEQYLNLYMAYRPIDYKKTFSDLQEIFKELKSGSNTIIFDVDISAHDKQNLITNLISFLDVPADFFSKLDDEKLVYKELENVYFIPLSKVWNEYNRGVLTNIKPKSAKGIIQKILLLKFGVLIRNTNTKSMESGLEKPEKDIGTLEMNVYDETPYTIHTDLSDDNGTKSLLHSFEKNRRGYINWFIKVTMNELPGYRQCFTDKFDIKDQCKYDKIDNIRECFFAKEKPKYDSYDNFIITSKVYLDKKQHWAIIPDRMFTKNLNIYNNRIIDMIGGGIRSGWMFAEDDDYNNNKIYNGLDSNIIPFNCTLNIANDKKKLYSESHKNNEQETIDYLKKFKELINSVNNYGMFGENFKIKKYLDKANDNSKRYQKEKELREMIKDDSLKEFNVNLYSSYNVKNASQKEVSRYSICNNGLMGRLYFPEIKIGMNKMKIDKKEIYDLFDSKKINGKQFVEATTLSGDDYYNNNKDQYSKSFYSYGQITSCNTNIGYSFNIAKLSGGEKFETYQDFFRTDSEYRNTNLYGNKTEISEQKDLSIPSLKINTSNDDKDELKLEDVESNQNVNTACYLGSNHILFNSLYDDTTYTARRRLGNSSAINNLVSFQYKNSPIYDFTMSYIHYSNSSNTSDDDKEKCTAPYIFKKGDDYYIIPFENINNLSGIKYRTTNFFTVCTTSNTNALTDDVSNFNLSEYKKYDDNILASSHDQFIDNIMYIGNYNFYEAVTSANIFGKLNLGGEKLDKLDANMLFGGVNKENYYPIFPLSCAVNITNVIADSIYTLDKKDIKYETGIDISSFITPPAPVTKQDIYIFDGLDYRQRYNEAPTDTGKYLRLLRRVLSGVSFGSQLAFFNIASNYKSINNDFNNTTVNQGYTVSIYGTDISSNHIRCGMTHYQIADNKIKLQEQKPSDYKTQFDFSIGAKMLSLVVGCLISSADRSRQASNFYQAAYYTDNTTNKFTNKTNMDITGNYLDLFGINKGGIDNNPGIPTIIPPSYMLKNIEKFTYYQNSNIFNYRPIKSKSNIFKPGKLFDNFSSMYDVGKSLLPIGGYYKNLDPDNTIDDITIEEGLKGLLENNNNNITTNDIWTKQNGEIHEINDKIYLGVYKHSLLNNIITDNYDVLSGTANKYIKNLGELIIYISTLGVMLSWLSIYHYTTKGDYVGAVGTGDVDTDVKMCYGRETLYPFSMDIKNIEEKYKIYPCKLNSENIKDINDPDKLKSKDIITEDGNIQDKIMDWKSKINYNYGGLLTFIHDKYINNKISNIISRDNKKPYVTVDSKYTWRAPSLLYYSSDVEGPYFYDIINNEDKLKKVGEIIKFADIDKNRLLNIDKCNEKLFYINPLMYSIQETKKNIKYNNNVIKDSVNKSAYTQMLETRTNEDKVNDVLKGTISLYNYGGVNNIQYMIQDNRKTDFYERYDTIYRKIQQNHDSYIKHSSIRGKSMIDFWRDLQLLPTYVDGLDFNINTGLIKNSGEKIQENRSGFRNIGGDNGLVTIGGGEMEIEYNEYGKIKSTSELIVQKILIKMGIKTSIRNYFNRAFNGKYLNIEKKKLEDLDDVNKLVDNVDVKNEDIEDEDIYKPLKFYNNIKSDNILPGLFHNDSINKGDKTEILGGTLMSYTNIKNFVEKFKGMIDEIDEFKDDQLKNLVKQYTRALYKIHQVLFEVPLMNYKKDDYKDKLGIERLGYYSKIETLIQSINTNGLTVYQTNDKDKKKKINDLLEYTAGEIIPDLNFNLDYGKEAYIGNKYSQKGTTVLKDTSEKYTSNYMSLFNDPGQKTKDDTKRIIQKITVAHQKEFIDAFTAMINLSIIEYYGVDLSDDGSMYKKAELLEKIYKKSSDNYFFKLGLKGFECDDLKFSKSGSSYPKININEFFRIYYILQDQDPGNRSNGNIFSLDDYIRHHLNILGDSVVTYTPQKYSNIIKNEFVKSNIGIFDDGTIKQELGNINNYVEKIERDDKMKKIVEEIGEEIPLGCGTKFLGYSDNNVAIAIAQYYNDLSSDSLFQKRLDTTQKDIKKELLKEVASIVRDNRFTVLGEKIKQGSKDLVQKIRNIYKEYNLNISAIGVGTSLKESIGQDILEKASNFAFIKRQNLKYKNKKQMGGAQTSNDFSEEKLKIALLRLTFNVLHEQTNLPELKERMGKYDNEIEIFRNSQKKIITDIKRYLELRKKSTDKNLYYKEIQLNIFKQDDILVKMQKIINEHKGTVERILESIILQLLYVESDVYTNYLIAPASIYPSLSTLGQENKDIIAHFKKDVLSVLEINKKIFADIINYLNRGKSIDIVRFESFYGSPNITNYIKKTDTYYGNYLNTQLYCDASNSLCKQNTTEKNPPGIWIIVESVTFPVRDRKILSKNVVYSLYDILTGRLIYCIGGLVRDHLHYKYNVNSSNQSLTKRIKELTRQAGEQIFGSEKEEKRIRLETFFYKIPKVYSFGEISGPILSISDPSIEGNNLYYLKIKLDPQCIFYKNGLVYFTPFSKRYIDLIKGTFEYDLNLNIETDTESYLWYWNVLELYNYIENSSLSGADVDEIQTSFFKNYLEVDGELGNCISKEMRINVRRGLIDMYIQPKPDLQERATLIHSKLFKFEDLPGASSGPKVQYGTTGILKISAEDIDKINIYAHGLEQLDSSRFDFNDKEDIKSKFIKISDNKIDEKLSIICDTTDQYNIQPFNTDSLSMLRKNPIFSYDGLKGYETIDACVWINRIKTPDMKKLFHAVLIKVDEYNELTQICRYLKRNNFVKTRVEEMAEKFKELYKNRSKINRDNKDPTMYLKLVFFTVLKYLEPTKSGDFIHHDEKEVLKIYKRVLFEIVFDNKITNFNNELMRQATKDIRNYLDVPVDIKVNLRKTVKDYLTGDKTLETHIDAEIEIINKLIYDSNRDSNYYGKYLIILSTLYVKYEITKKKTSGGAVPRYLATQPSVPKAIVPAAKLGKQDAPPQPPPPSSTTPASTTPASSKQYGSSPFRTGNIYKKMYLTEYWKIDATYLNKIFTTIKDQLILNRKHIAKEIGEEPENSIYSPFNKCIIPRLFNSYDFENNSSGTCLDSPVYILGYETSSTKLTLDNLIVVRYMEKYKIYGEITNTIKKVTTNLKRLIDKKTNTIELAKRNTQELRYITAKYRNVFELNYFKFLGKDLLKSLLELTEGAKVSFMEYFNKDIGIEYTENKKIIDKCLSTHKKMIYGNENKLNSYGYLNSMYLGVLLNIWGGNKLFNKPLEYLIIEQEKYSEEIIWSYLVKVTWFLEKNKEMEEYIFGEGFDKDIIKYHMEMWYYPGYNNYYIYYADYGIAARFLSCFKLIIETNEYIDNAYPEPLATHINLGILHFNSNRIRHTESSIGALTENGFKELIKSKSGGSKQEIDYLYNGYNDYQEYGRYLMTNKRNDNEFNIYTKIKNKDIQSLDKLEKLIIKYRTKIERIEKKNEKI